MANERQNTESALVQEVQTRTRWRKRGNVRARPGRDRMRKLNGCRGRVMKTRGGAEEEGRACACGMRASERARVRASVQAVACLRLCCVKERVRSSENEGSKKRGEWSQFCDRSKKAREKYPIGKLVEGRVDKALPDLGIPPTRGTRYGQNRGWQWYDRWKSKLTHVMGTREGRTDKRQEG
eukprot:394706-Pleurochrysis_carterae.AAC.4